MSRVFPTLCCVVLLSAVPGPALAQGGDPAAAVFPLQVVHRGQDGLWRVAGYGTAFFVSADGRALTNSHVVYRAQHDPEHYRLLAIVGDEFYGADIICASALPYDPTTPLPRDGIPISRDIAEIQVAAPTLPFARWDVTAPGRFSVIAHRGPLPAFPTISLGGWAPEGDAVTIVGFEYTPIPAKRAEAGTVTRTARLGDGTEIFLVQSSRPARPGDSGSPVLDKGGRAVGILTWYAASGTGGAQTSETLARACRHAAR